MMPLLTLKAKIIISSIIAAGLFYSGWQVRDWQADSEKLKEAEKQKKQIEHLETVRVKREVWYQAEATALESDLAALRLQKQKTIIKRIEYEKPVYHDCVLPVDGLLALNASINAVNATRASKRPATVR